MDDLRVLGIDWDGEPARQSERTDLYRAALERLREGGRVYPCWCSRAEVRAAPAAPHGDLPEGAYPGTCRDLTQPQRVERARQTGREPALRLDARAERVAVRDRLRDPIEAVVDDIVLWRGDDTPAYNLAVVVDDADQGIEEVVRGDDLLDTTPRQALLCRLLGIEPPAYAHVPLVLGPDGKRLAKRHGDVTLAKMEPAEALRWIARSLAPAVDGEAADAAGMLGSFQRDRIPAGPVVFRRPA